MRFKQRLIQHACENGPHRADFIDAIGDGRVERACDLERVFEILAIDDLEAEQLLLGLRKGTIEDDRRGSSRATSAPR